MMQTFQITLEGHAQPGDYATKVEAEEAAITLRQQHQGKTIEVQEKAASPATAEPHVVPNAQEQPTQTGRKSTRPQP